MFIYPTRRQRARRIAGEYQLFGVLVFGALKQNCPEHIWYCPSPFDRLHYVGKIGPRREYRAVFDRIRQRGRPAKGLRCHRYGYDLLDISPHTTRIIPQRTRYLLASGEWVRILEVYGA